MKRRMGKREQGEEWGVESKEKNGDEKEGRERGKNEEREPEKDNRQ